MCVGNVLVSTEVFAVYLRVLRRFLREYARLAKVIKPLKLVVYPRLAGLLDICRIDEIIKHTLRNTAGFLSPAPCVNIRYLIVVNAGYLVEDAPDFILRGAAWGVLASVDERLLALSFDNALDLSAKRRYVLRQIVCGSVNEQLHHSFAIGYITQTFEQIIHALQHGHIEYRHCDISYRLKSVFNDIAVALVIRKAFPNGYPDKERHTLRSKPVERYSRVSYINRIVLFAAQFVE